MGYRFNCFKEIIIEMDGEELIEIKSEKREIFFNGSKMEKHNLSKIIRDIIRNSDTKSFKGDE